VTSEHNIYAFIYVDPFSLTAEHSCAARNDEQGGDGCAKRCLTEGHISNTKERQPSTEAVLSPINRYCVLCQLERLSKFGESACLAGIQGYSTQCQCNARGRNVV
jgi:hypothetical protein